MLETSAAPLDKLFHVDHGTLHSIPVPSSESSCTLAGFCYTDSLVTDCSQIQNVHLEKPLYIMLPHPYLNKETVPKKVHVIFQVDKEMQHYTKLSVNVY